MPICATSTSGGKGNIGHFYEREPRICAAGIPTAEESAKVEDLFKQYNLEDNVDALLHDSVIPPSKPKPLPPLRKPIPLDLRYACNSQVSQLINPPVKTKLQTLVDEIKGTIYKSYWNKNVGKRPDYVPKLPENFDLVNTTMGKKTPFHGRLYDVIMPKEPLPDITPTSKKLASQTNRNYRQPFSSDLIYGHRTNINTLGGIVKCAMTDDNVVLGTSNYTVISSVQNDYQKKSRNIIGKVFAPNENIKELQKAYDLPSDDVPGCLAHCKLSSKKEFLKKCIGYLNKVRKSMEKSFDPDFLSNFYLNLKYADKSKTGWLPKEIVYQFCISRQIRFDAKFIEPLLAVFNAFDGKCIEYKTFVFILNYKEPLTNLPKLNEMAKKCIDYRTTYGEMTKPYPEPDNRLMAGIPSGRYLDNDRPVTPDNYLKVHNYHLPYENDMKSCLNPNIAANFNISHRDMYAKRDEATIRRVFEASGEKYSDEEFGKLYKKAQEYHPQGWVSYETFRQALRKP